MQFMSYLNNDLIVNQWRAKGKKGTDRKLRRNKSSKSKKKKRDVFDEKRLSRVTMKNDISVLPHLYNMIIVN